MFNIITLFCYLIGTITQALLGSRKTLLHISVYSIILPAIILQGYIPFHAAKDVKEFLHILLSILAFNVLFIAGLQAIALALQEKFLKPAYFNASHLLPPIETMEKKLFQLIAVGSILLSLILGTSIYFFHSILMKQFMQKTILTLIAWLVFNLLLVGRYYFGWRGKKAIYFTLSGVILISAIYFSSIIIMELLH